MRYDFQVEQSLFANSLAAYQFDAHKNFQTGQNAPPLPRLKALLQGKAETRWNQNKGDCREVISPVVGD